MCCQRFAWEQQQPSFRSFLPAGEMPDRVGIGLQEEETLPFAQASNSTRPIKKGQIDQSTQSNHRWPCTTSFFTALE